MEIQSCACGRRHICAIDDVFVGYGAISKLSELTKGKRGVLIVADENTYNAFREQGGSVSHPCVSHCVFPGETLLIPDEKALLSIENAMDGNTDIIIGIGGGTINDLCKEIAYRKGMYYVYVATAPSMDGYASDGAALILDGMKVTLKTAPPKVIICDTDILKNAPIELIRAGVGDILGKYSCLNDWLLAAYVKGEYFCQRIYNEVMEATDKVAENLEKILARDGDGIDLLAHALVKVGIDMSYAGSSRPASGSEHHLAHFFEIYSLEQGQAHRAHGIDVGQASYYTALLRDAILQTDRPFNFHFDEESYFAAVKPLLPRAAGGIVELQRKTALHGNKNGNYDLDGIKAILKKAPRADNVRVMLEKAGLPVDEMIKFYGNATAKNALRYGKELKDRFTVLWLYEYLGWEMLDI